MFLAHIPYQYVEKLQSCKHKCIIWTKGEKRNWEEGRDFFQTSNYIRAIFWKSINYIYMLVIFYIACAIQYHRIVFIFIVRRIMSTQLWLNVSGHSLPTKLYIDPYMYLIALVNIHIQVSTLYILAYIPAIVLESMQIFRYPLYIY